MCVSAAVAPSSSRFGETRDAFLFIPAIKSIDGFEFDFAHAYYSGFLNYKTVKK